MGLHFEKPTFSLIKTDKELELEIANAEHKHYATTGANRIALDIVIRDDIEQEFAGRHIFTSIWENDVTRDITTGRVVSKDDFDKMSFEQKKNCSTIKEYNQYRISQFVYAQQEPESIKDVNGQEIPNPKFKSDFDDIEEVAQFLNGLRFKAKISIIKQKDNETNDLNWKTITRSSHYETGVQTSKNLEKIDVNDDDLPF